MRYAIVAVAQQSLRLYPDLDSYKRDVERFFRLAEMKHARLLVFPQRSGLMVIPPLVEGFRTGLLKKADLSRGRYRGWWERTRTQVIRGTAKLLGADVEKELHKALNEMPEFIWQTYVDVFASLAYDYKITVVAGSGYFKDVNDGVLREIVTVFGPDGDILGQQAKVILEEGDEEWVQAGSGWQAIETPLGRLGILVGEEVMYPEVGRLLAYQGVHSIVALGAARDDTRVQILRDGLQARVTDNQVFGSLAFVVGPDPFAPEDTPPYRGRSVIMAPPGMLPRRNVVIVEAGSATAEVLVTARWDFEALQAYWEQSPIPVRRRLPAKVAGPVLAALYGQQATLDEAMQALPLVAPKALEVESEPEGYPAAGAEGMAEEAPTGEQAAAEEGAEMPGEAGEAEAGATTSAVAEEVGEVEGEAVVSETSLTEAETAPSQAPEPATKKEDPPPWDEVPAPREEGASAISAAETSSSEEAEVETDVGSVPVEPAEAPAAAEAETSGQAADTTVGEAGPESAKGKAPPEPEAPEPETREPEVITPPSASTPSPPDQPTEMQSQVTVDARPIEEDLPSSVWETIRAELQRAAEVIKSMEWGGDKPAEERATTSAQPQAEPAAQEQGKERTQGGWFHQLVERARQQASEDKDTLDEF